MNILVINGSPKGENSDTMKLTHAFLDGMVETAEIVDTMKSDIRPCTGCYSCWFKTLRKCCQQDDVAAILEKFKAADLVIWSTPLYCYSVPSNCKALMDRTISLSCPTMYVADEGKTHHPGTEDGVKKVILISGCGFPDRKGNFDALIFQFQRMFGSDIPMILCMEAPLFSFNGTEYVTKPYLEAVRSAGMEYKQTGRISADTQMVLDGLMLPSDEYRKGINE